MKTRKNRIKNRPGSLLLIVGLFVGSAVFRIAFSSSEAIANSADIPAAPVPEVFEKPSTVSTAALETSALLKAIRRREERVKEIEMKQDLREKSLSVAQHEVERRITALELAEERLRATLARADTAAEDDVAKLTTVYENMKPKDSAALFEAMEPRFAAGFLGRMRPDAAAGIMAGLKPETAYTISVILAGRNAKAPKT